MKKDHTRDYATEAFRFYKAVGGAAAFKTKIWDTAMQNRQSPEVKGSGISKPTEAALMRAQNAVDDLCAAVADLEAVERVLSITGRMLDGSQMRKAVEIVYFTNADKPLTKGDIQARVHKASLYIPVSEPTVYRYLAKARRLFSIERGLRL